MGGNEDNQNDRDSVSIGGKQGNTLIDNQSVWEVTLKIIHVP